MEKREIIKWKKEKTGVIMEDKVRRSNIHLKGTPPRLN